VQFYVSRQALKNYFFVSLLYQLEKFIYREARSIVALSEPIKDAIEKIATELEGYEDLHASAELRRDILRNLAPLVIAEAQQCAT
jgi:hypothetical protein